jgi:glycogenin glucosyltransferase
VQKNPEEKLEQLRRASLAEFEHLKEPVHPVPPLRALPEHSVPTPEPPSDEAPLGLDGATDEKPTTTDKPLFMDPDFGRDGISVKTEEVLSPTAESELD